MKLLLVAYFFPPCRDTGALRPASMARWLARLGHEVTVLTTSAYGEAPFDGVEVVHTFDARGGGAGSMFDADNYSGRAHPLSRVLVPEALVAAWAPFARRRALRLVRERSFDAVITTSPPESAHLVGRALAKHGLPWVADVRDAWTFEPLRPRFPTSLQRRLDERLERRWLGAADAVVCVSEPAAADLRRRGIADPEVIANGWDAESAPPASAAGTGDVFDPARASLLYTGRFGSYGRDPTALVEGMRRLAATNREAAAKLELVIAGPLTEAESELFDTDVSPARIVHAGSVPRDRALALQRAADALLLIAQPTRSQLLNIKLFEYLASGRPVLALATGTEAGRVAEEVGGRAVRADDPDAITPALALVANGELPAAAPEAVAPYTYPAPAERMAAAVERAISSRRSP